MTSSASTSSRKSAWVIFCWRAKVSRSGRVLSICPSLSARRALRRSGANLGNAYLSGTILIAANLSGANLKGATLKGVRGMTKAQITSQAHTDKNTRF
ncbi:MAG: pentapeptide repeat-containing protein [Micromonosporaceae bacterium]